MQTKLKIAQEKLRVYDSIVKDTAFNDLDSWAILDALKLDVYILQLKANIDDR
jgi:hypothetical protein